MFNWSAFKVAIAALLLIFGVLIYEASSREGTPQPEFYWMPYCPYGLEAAGTLLNSIKDNPQNQLPQFFIIAIDKTVTNGKSESDSNIGSANGCASDESKIENSDLTKSRFLSLHGRDEVDEGIRQVIISKKYPREWRSYLTRFVSNPREDWVLRCKSTGIDFEQLRDLASSNVGQELYAQNIKRARDRGITVSPTLIINGVDSSALLHDHDELRGKLCAYGLLKSDCLGILCNSITGCEQKENFVTGCQNGVCKYTPMELQPDAVTAYVITSSQCPLTENFPLENALRGWQSRLRIVEVDLSTKEAQGLIGNISIDSLPLLICNKEIENRKWGLKCLQDLGFIKQGQRYLLKFGYDNLPFELYARISSDHGHNIISVDNLTTALILHRMKRFEEASRSYEAALRDNELNSTAWNNLGTILYDVGGLKNTAGMMFKKAAEISPNYELALQNLGKYYSEKGKDEEAAEVNLRLAWNFINEKRYNQSVSLLKPAVSFKNLEFSARKALAVVALHQDNLPEALRQLDACLRINSSPDGDFANLLAGIYYRLGESENAVNWYLYSLNTVDPSPKAYENLCYLLSKIANWRNLLKIASKASATMPNDMQYYFYQTQALAKLERPSEAIEVLRKIGKNALSQPRAAYELSILYSLEKENALALKYDEQFIRTIEKQAHPKLSNQCIKMADLSLSLEKYELAARGFEQAVRSEPSNVIAHKSLSFCYRKLGKKKYAIEQENLAKEFGGT